MSRRRVVWQPASEAIAWLDTWVKQCGEPVVWHCEHLEDGTGYRGPRVRSACRPELLACRDCYAHDLSEACYSRCASCLRQTCALYFVRLLTPRPREIAIGELCPRCAAAVHRDPRVVVRRPS